MTCFMEAWQRADVGWSEKEGRSSDGEGSRTVGLVAVLLASVGLFSILSASVISVAAEEEAPPPPPGGRHSAAAAIPRGWGS